MWFLERILWTTCLRQPVTLHERLLPSSGHVLAGARFSPCCLKSLCPFPPTLRERYVECCWIQLQLSEGKILKNNVQPFREQQLLEHFFTIIKKTTAKQTTRPTQPQSRLPAPAYHVPFPSGGASLIPRGLKGKGNDMSVHPPSTSFILNSTSSSCPAVPSQLLTEQKCAAVSDRLVPAQALIRTSYM